MSQGLVITGLAATAMTDPAAKRSNADATDESLMEALRNGEANAGDELVRRYAASLLRFLRRMTNSDQTAEELHQQTWLSVMDHLDRFRPTDRGGFRAWVFRIATNKANDVWRTAKRDRAGLTGLSLASGSATGDASTGPEAADEVKKLKWAIEQLPESQKQVLMLRYYSGMKFVEIAELLGCPLNTALGRMHKATLKLRDLMQEPSAEPTAASDAG